MGEGRRPSQLAIASIAAAIAQILLPVLAAIVAIVTGHLARRRIRRDPSLRGGGLALAGIILGYAGIALIAVLIAWFVYDDLQQTHAEVRRIDRAVADVRVADLGTVIADRHQFDGFDLGNHPEREIALGATDESATNLENVVGTALQRAGFAHRGLEEWERGAGGFVIVEVIPLESGRTSFELGGTTIAVPRGQAVVFVELSTG